MPSFQTIRIHPHAYERMLERGCDEKAVADTVRSGEQLAAKFGRFCFRKNFVYQALWRGKDYANKQIEVFAVETDQDWLVLTVITRYF